MHVYRDIDTHAPEYQPMTFYSSDGEALDDSEWLAHQAAGQSGDAEVIDLPTAAGGEQQS
jgi:hypothetical protein